MPKPARRRWLPASMVLLWLLATGLLAASPVLYFVAGASDGATEASRIGLAAIPALPAWLLLVLATGRARRALALLLFAAGVLLLARRLGATTAIQGDTAWAWFWAVSGLVWAALSAALARRR